ncbi:MAG: nucleotidyltransferase family protein [Candidatus Eremiobacteraeota bacterium]|nr:nucleotidyltransferase family protein [Candidatus Eremiobacteraeota bacterium]
MSDLMAAITAGGRVDGSFAEQIGTDVKALAPFGHRRLIDAALDAARACGARRIGVVGSPEVHAYCSGRIDDPIPESPSGEENIQRALAYAAGAPLLLLTSDLPFITADAVNHFLRRCDDVDAAMPLAAERDYELMFPGAPQHVVVLGGERLANGSVFYFAPGVAARVAQIAVRLFSARKSLVRMATLLGPGLLVKFAIRRLSIRDIEDRAHEIFGLAVRAVRDASPSMCYDIDVQTDYCYAVERLARG